jgi:hypothetical protein
LRIAVQLVAPTVRSYSPPQGAARGNDAVSNLARELHISLEPMHPESTDDALRTWYSVDVPDEGTAQTVVAQLRRQPEVAAAFLKPPDALP